MAFNQKLHDHKQQQKVGNDVEPSCKELGNTTPNRIQQLRDSDCNLESQTHKGSRKRSKDIDGDTSLSVRRRKIQKSRATAVGETEDLSDIDDVEVSGYLLKDKEKHYKRIIWEALNRDHSKVKKQKEAIQTKKDNPAKRAAKATKKVEPKRLSSKINYAALEKLTDELIESPGHDGDVQSRDTSLAMEDSQKRKCNEFEQNSEAYETNEVYGEQAGDIYDRGSDEFVDDESGDIYYGGTDEYGDNESYDFEE